MAQENYAKQARVTELFETLRTGLLKARPVKPVEWLMDRLSHADMAEHDMSEEEKGRLRRSQSISRPTYFKPQQAHIMTGTVIISYPLLFSLSRLVYLFSRTIQQGNCFY